MRKIALLVLVFSFLLAACSSPITPSPAAPAATSAPSDPPAVPQPTPTQAAVSTEAPAATEAPAVTEAPAASAGAITYQLVPGESTLQYEVGETFIDQNNRFNTAIGTTPQVSGSIVVDLAIPKNSSIGTISAAISQFTSHSGQRDRAIRNRFIQTSRFPMVTFAPTQIDGLPEAYTPGQELSLQISGDLTIRDVTRPVQFSATIKADGSSLTGEAATTILMSEFGFGPISIAGILNTEDEVKVTLKLVARP